MLQSEAGYIGARPHPPDRRTLLRRTAGPYIRVTSANHPRAEVAHRPGQVGNVQRADMSRCSNLRAQKVGLLDHFVSADEQVRCYTSSKDQARADHKRVTYLYERPPKRWGRTRCSARRCQRIAL